MEDFRKALRNTLRTRRSSFFSVLVLSVVFFCLAAALWMTMHVRLALGQAEGARRTTIYLKSDVTTEQRQELELELRRNEGPRGLSSIRFVSADDMKASLAQELGDDSMQGLPAEVFSASYELTWVSPQAFAAHSVTFSNLAQMAAVESIESYDTFYQQLDRFERWLGVGLFALCALVAICVFAMMSSILRLALVRRAPEIEVARLCGATAGFIRTPFVIEGTTHVVVSAVLGIGMMALAYLAIRSSLEPFMLAAMGVKPGFIPLRLSAIVVLCATLLGAVGSAWSVNRYIASSFALNGKRRALA